MPGRNIPPQRVEGRGAGWYRGDCHVHSVHSDGELTPGELALRARAAGLDFLAITEHNSADAHGSWGEHAGDDLLVVLGEEVTTRTGHWLALGIRPGQVVDWNYSPADGVIGRRLDEVHAVGGVCVVAHPHAPYPSGDFMFPLQGFDVVEVWNGQWASELPWNADNEAALAAWGESLAAGVRAGAWRPAMGNSDTHLDGQLGTPHTVVFAEELSAAAVLAGIRAGRSWIAESAAVHLSFTARADGRTGAGMGERLTTHGAPVVVEARVAGVPGADVVFHTDRGEVRRAPLDESGTGSVRWHTTAEDADFVRVEVRRPGGGVAALGNPILLG